MKDMATVDVPSKDPAEKKKTPGELAALKADGAVTDAPAEEDLVRQWHGVRAESRRI